MTKGIGATAARGPSTSPQSADEGVDEPGFEVDAELAAELRAAIADVERGDVDDGDEVIAELRRRARARK